MVEQAVAVHQDVHCHIAVSPLPGWQQCCSDISGRGYGKHSAHLVLVLHNRRHARLRRSGCAVLIIERLFLLSNPSELADPAFSGNQGILLVV
jgi:hypothetical protein